MRKKGTRRKKFALCKRENTTIEYYEKRAETEKGGKEERERERVTLYVSNPQSFFPDQPSKEKSTSFKPGENRAIL